MLKVGPARQEETQQEDHTDVLAEVEKYNSFVSRTMQDIQGFSGVSMFQAFKEEAENMITETRALSGALYTDEGKQAKIKEDIPKIAAKHKEQIREKERELREAREQALETIDDKLHERPVYETEADVKRKEIFLKQTEGRIKSSLVSANTPRDVEHEFKNLIRRGEKDKELGSFLIDNYYLFADRVNQLEASDAEKKVSIHNISLQAKRLEPKVMSEDKRALLKAKEYLEKQTPNGIGANRLIDNYVSNRTR